MRHASSPNALPTAAAAARGNPDLERQLDRNGLADARAMGAALKRLRIRIGEVMSSPSDAYGPLAFGNAPLLAVVPIRKWSRLAAPVSR